MKNYWLEQRRLRLEDGYAYLNNLQKKCEKRWKRVEIMSSRGSLIMKEDALDNCGAWGPEKVSIAR